MYTFLACDSKSFLLTLQPFRSNQSHIRLQVQTDEVIISLFPLKNRSQNHFCQHYKRFMVHGHITTSAH